MRGPDVEACFRQRCRLAAPATCRQVEHAGLTFAWLAPGEWLVMGANETVGMWLARVNAAGDEELFALDISHAGTALLIEGSTARPTLAAHCPIDLWPAKFPVGAVARSLLGDASMFVARLADAGDRPRFRIIIDQTMAAYAARLLTSAAAR
jgi:sarcosine oxidase subunit gamma